MQDALPIQGFLRKTALVLMLRVAVDAPEEFVSELRLRLEQQVHPPEETRIQVTASKAADL
jgi:hypothetical protein